MSRSLKGLAGLTAAGLIACLTPVSSQATMIIELASGVTIVTIPDNSILDNDPAVGKIEYIGPVGVFDVNVTTGLSKPITGSATSPDLNLNSVNVSSTTPGSLSIILTDTDFSGPVGPSVATLDFGGTTNGTIGIDAFLDSTNLAFGGATPAGSLGVFGPGPFSDAAVSPVSPTALYSATLATSIVHPTSGSITSFGAQLRVVPEPGSIALVLFGAGMLGLRRRR